jgi:hypothetical protein
MQQTLIELARERVHSGEFSERRLAHLCGLSQCHMHNVLRGLRLLSNESADALMRVLELEIPDLVARISAQKSTAISIVPMMRAKLGPGADADPSSLRGYLPVPAALVMGTVSPVAAVLAPDLVLPTELTALDVVLMDQNPAQRASPASGLWVVAEGTGLRVRYLVLENDRLQLGNAVTRGDQGRWQSIPMHGRNILNIVRARIVWMGREMEK